MVVGSRDGKMETDPPPELGGKLFFDITKTPAIPPRWHKGGREGCPAGGHVLGVCGGEMNGERMRAICRVCD